MKGYLDKIRFILEMAKNREAFFRLVSQIFPSLDPRYIAIERAYNAMKDAFRDKYREGGERYFEHLRAVALIYMIYLRGKDHELIIACLMHDSSEDVPFWPIDRIRQEFGSRVAMYVQRMTKGKVVDFSSREERDRVYHDLFRTADRNFFLIKLPDRIHNLLTLGACSKEKIRRKIQETKLYYLPHAEEHLILYHEILAAIEEIEDNYLKDKEEANGNGSCGGGGDCK